MACGSRSVPRKMWFFPLLFCCGTLLDLCCGQGLSVIGPKIIRPHRPFKVVFSNSLNRTVRLEMSLSGSRKSIARKNVSIAPSQLVTREMPVASIESGEYVLSIDSVDADFAFAKNVELEYSNKTMSVFIQTDKPIYNPGDLLRFRVMMIDADTRPVTTVKSFKIGIYDSDENSIRQWPYAKLSNGVFQSAFQIASSPLLGNWTIKVKTKEGELEKHFELKEYVLPKFFVKITATEVPVISNGKLKLLVESSYTFGGYVDGIVKVDLYEEAARQPYFSKTLRITGRASVESSLPDDFEIEQNEFSKDIMVKVEMKEAFSNRTVNITEFIPVFLNPYKISVVSETLTFRQGELFKSQVVIRDHRGFPPKEIRDVNIKISDEDENEQLITKKHNDQGIVNLDFSPLEGNPLYISVEYDSVNYETVETIYAAQSERKQDIKIVLHPRSRVHVNKRVIFIVTCSERLKFFSYIIISRGAIISGNNINMQNKKKAQFEVSLTPDMAPHAKIIAFYNRPDNFVYHILDLHFPAFTNKFKVGLDKKQYVAGERCDIEIDAAEDSHVFLQAIDQSVLLLGRDVHDLTRDGVLQDLSQYVSTDPNVYDSFHAMGLFLQGTAERDGPAPRSRRSIDSTTLIKPVSKIIHIRTVFPEAWLWENYTMNGNSFIMLQNTIPDTITSWYLTGYALSPTQGLGIMNQPFEFVVKQPFYIILNLPYSIKRDEVALVQATLFNFLGFSASFEVSLYIQKDQFEFIDKSSTDKTKRTKNITVPNSSGMPISFMIKAKQLGEIAIKVEAVNLEINDAVEHMLRVTPESRRYELNEARFIEHAKLKQSHHRLNLQIPRHTDDGSIKIEFSVSEDITNSTVENLDNLIGLPTGCGEQNMIYFAPNIVILDYLSETDKITSHVKTKVLNFMANGYQNQLKFKRSDGSFSVWGPKDQSGSTFLTAFVAKCFKLADKHMEIDRNIVTQAFRWLASVQGADGRFTEKGYVAHRDMQGGLESANFALTAFVAIAFLENPDIAEEYRAVVTKTVTFLAKNVDNMSKDYELALTAYALKLDKHPQAENTFDILLQSSKYDNNAATRYWNNGPEDIEIAGYALLTYIANNDYYNALPIMHWLTAQRFATGGFPGIQSTFIGLKALAKYAANFSAKKNSYRITLEHKPNKKYNFDFEGKTAGQGLKQELPADVRQVDVTIDGIGFGIFQVAYQYYQNIQVSKYSFGLNVTLLNTTTLYVQHLQVCVNFNKTEAYNTSNMALVEVFFPSGLIAPEDAVKDLSVGREIKNTELRYGATSVVVYYNSLGVETNCFEVTAYRRYKVAMHRPSYVVVYDYDERDKFAIKQYEGKVLQLCDICEDEDCESLSC